MPLPPRQTPAFGLRGKVVQTRPSQQRAQSVQPTPSSAQAGTPAADPLIRAASVAIVAPSTTRSARRRVSPEAMLFASPSKCRPSMSRSLPEPGAMLNLKSQSTAAEPVHCLAHGSRFRMATREGAPPTATAVIVIGLSVIVRGDLRMRLAVFSCAVGVAH